MQEEVESLEPEGELDHNNQEELMRQKVSKHSQEEEKMGPPSAE